MYHLIDFTLFKLDIFLDIFFDTLLRRLHVHIRFFIAIKIYNIYMTIWLYIEVKLKSPTTLLYVHTPRYIHIDEYTSLKSYCIAHANGWAICQKIYL